MSQRQRLGWEKAQQIWQESGGKITAKELAEQAGVSINTIHKWKKEKNWESIVEGTEPKRKQGGQPGNRNAVGAGAPRGNTNAETHGAYSTVRMENLETEQRKYIEGLTLETKANMLAELQKLMAKEIDLQNRINALDQADPEKLYTDRVIEVHVPKSRGGTSKRVTKTVMMASAFGRRMKLEAEWNKVHGRIIKLMDSIRSYELESDRVNLEKKKYNLSKQKIMGEYSINPENGEIDDETEGLLEEDFSQ